MCLSVPPPFPIVLLIFIPWSSVSFGYWLVIFVTYWPFWLVFWFSCIPPLSSAKMAGHQVEICRDGDSPSHTSSSRDNLPSGLRTPSFVEVHHSLPPLLRVLSRDDHGPSLRSPGLFTGIWFCRGVQGLLGTLNIGFLPFFPLSLSCCIWCSYPSLNQVVTYQPSRFLGVCESARCFFFSAFPCMFLWDTFQTSTNGVAGECPLSCDLCPYMLTVV